MALAPEQKAQLLADLLFKDIAAGKATSSSLTAFFEELVNSRKLIFPSQLAAEEELIPATAMAVPDVIEEITDLEMIHIPGANSKAFYHPDLAGTIPFNFGDGTSYLYQLKKQDNSSIPFGLNDWYFNPHAGVLYFMEGFPTGVSPSQPPKISCYKYIGARGILPLGSTETYDSVKSIATDPLAVNSGPGDRYLIGVGATGIWQGRDGQIAEKKNVNYGYTIPEDGATVKVDNEDGRVYHHEGAYTGSYAWIRYTFNTVRIANAIGTDNYTADIDPPLIEHSRDILLLVFFSNANTGPSTFNPDNKGAKAIKISDSTGNLTDLVANDLQTGVIHFLWYNGSEYELFGTQKSRYISKTLDVDPVYGDDMIAEPYNSNKPFKTGNAAEGAAQPGDVVRFRPGIHTAVNLGKDGITYYDEPGAIHTNFVDTDPSTYTDIGKGDIRFKVCGYGDYSHERHWNTNNWNIEIVRLENVSHVEFESYKCSNIGDDGGVFLSQGGGTIIARVEEIYSGSVVAYGLNAGTLIDIKCRKVQTCGVFAAYLGAKVYIQADDIYSDLPHLFSDYVQPFQVYKDGKIEAKARLHYNPVTPNPLIAACIMHSAGGAGKGLLKFSGVLNIIKNKWFSFANNTNLEENTMIFEGEINLGAGADDATYVHNSFGTATLITKNCVIKSESATRTTGIIPADEMDYFAENTTVVLSNAEMALGSKCIFSAGARNVMLKGFFSNAPMGANITNVVFGGAVETGNPSITN